MQTLFLATRNVHKTREFAEILGPHVTVTDLTSTPHLPFVEETGSSFTENATLKAVAISHRVGGLVAADDSGLEVAALDGAPGVSSARYAGENASDGENRAKLLAELTQSSDRRARFVCAIALAKDGEKIAIFQGTVTGQITTAPHGKYGFGYDPIFIPNGFEQTFAELGRETKNRISHRADAISKLREYFRDG